MLIFLSAIAVVFVLLYILPAILIVGMPFSKEECLRNTVHRPPPPPRPEPPPDARCPQCGCYRMRYTRKRQ